MEENCRERLNSPTSAASSAHRKILKSSCIGRRSPRTSADLIGSNDDLLMEILIFLPPKSLIRFEMVSKHWDSLISSPSFSHLHAHRRSLLHKPPPSFILRGPRSKFFYFDPTTTTTSSNETTLIPVSFPSAYRYAGIIHSSHGLLLMHCRRSKLSPSTFCVYNPTTGKLRLLHQRPLKNRYDVYQVGFAFDPSTSPHYMVACWTNRLLRRKSSSIDVYDSEFHRWTQLTNYVDPGSRHNDFWDDGLYRLQLRAGHGTYVDVQKGSLKIRAPWATVDARDFGGVMPRGESNGYIFTVDGLLDIPMPEPFIRVLEFSEENKRLVSKHVIYLNDIHLKEDANGLTPHQLLDFIRREPEGESSCIFHVPGKIISYKPSDRSVEVLLDFRTHNIYQPNKLQFGPLDCYQLLQSLAPV